MTNIYYKFQYVKKKGIHKCQISSKQSSFCQFRVSFDQNCYVFISFDFCCRCYMTYFINEWIDLVFKEIVNIPLKIYITTQCYISLSRDFFSTISNYTARCLLIPKRAGRTVKYAIIIWYKLQNIATDSSNRVPNSLAKRITNSYKLIIH